jgi:hypothetical protein
VLVLAADAMTFSPLAVDWRSLTESTPSPGSVTPAVLSSPSRAWEYGAASALLTPDAEDGVLRVVFDVHEGVAGVALVAANYGALLTQEAPLHPSEGVTERVFVFPAAFGPCRLLLRTYDTNGPVRARFLGAQVGRRGDLSATQAAAVLGAARQSGPPPPDAVAALSVAPRDSTFMPLSLGNTCEAKFQIARVLQFRRDPDASELAFRLAMLPPRRGEDVFGWELFDWQGTSLRAVLAYLDRDFEGLFERADLEPFKNGVVHKELNTEHMHDFEYLLDDPRAEVTPDVLDRGFAAARRRFDAMRLRFKDILRRPGPFLYVHVCEDIPTEWDVHRLFHALRARSAEHRFRLLFVGYEGSDSPWGAFAHAVADKAFRPRSWDKPLGREWEGPDAAWDRALAPYRLAFPDGAPAGAEPGAALIVRTDPSC